MPDTSGLAAAAAKQNFHAVLMSHLVSNNTELRWVPGYLALRPAWVGGPWMMHYNENDATLYAPGYSEMSRVVRYETDVWMTGGGPVRRSRMRPHPASGHGRPRNHHEGDDRAAIPDRA